MSILNRRHNEHTVPEIVERIEQERDDSKAVWTDEDADELEAAWNYGRYYLAVNLLLWMNEGYDGPVFGNSESFTEDAEPGGVRE